MSPCVQACEMLTELKQQGGMPSLGMCMSLQLFSRPGLSGRFLAVGYEAGHVAIWDIGMMSAPVAVTRLHEEPVLGLFIDSSGAGAWVVKCDLKELQLYKNCVVMDRGLMPTCWLKNY